MKLRFKIGTASITIHEVKDIPNIGDRLDLPYPSGGIDYSKFYKINLDEACDQVATEAGHPALGRIIYLAFYWWNDVIDWANAVTDPTAVTEPSATMCQHGVLYRHTTPCEEDVDGIPVDKPEDVKEHCALCTANWERCKQNHYKSEEAF